MKLNLITIIHKHKIIDETDNYGYCDWVHYDSKGFIDLGKRFAEELIKLQNK